MTTVHSRAALVRLGQTVTAAAVAVIVAAASHAVAAAPVGANPSIDPPAACPPAPVALTAERFAAGLRQATDHGFLWRIVKDGRTSYLYGTIHAARLEWMFPGPRTAAALNVSDTLALELDVLDRDIQARLASSTRARPDEVLPDALAQRIARRMAADCIEPAQWQGLAPEFQVATLAVMATRRDGFDPAYAIDLVLDIVARNLGKPVVSLETPESQMSALRSPTAEAVIESVRSSLDDLDAGRSGPLVERLIRAWTAGDLATLDGYERWCECLRDDAERAAMKRLLDDRNPGLADSIDALHAQGHAVFAAVGSLHMSGPNGLPALMAQRGYRVTPVRFAR